MHLLAAAETRNISSIFVWSGVLVVLLLIAFAAYSYLKRWMNQPEETTRGGFTLSDLRELHRQGKMSDAEYELTRANMVKAAKRTTEQLPEVLPRRGVRPGSDQQQPPPTGT